MSVQSMVAFANMVLIFTPLLAADLCSLFAGFVAKRVFVKLQELDKHSFYLSPFLFIHTWWTNNYTRWFSILLETNV